MAIGVIGYIVALAEPPAVAFVVIFTTSVLGSAFAPAFVCAVWWQKANTPGALCSMIAGTVTAVTWEVMSLESSLSLAPMSAGLAVSSTTMIIVSLLTQKLYPVPTYVLASMKETKSLKAIPKAMLASSDFELRPAAGEIDEVLRQRSAK